MLPLSRMLTYGNTAPLWYSSPTTLVAYDSYLFNASGFNDYVNNTIRVGNLIFNISGVSPSLGSGSPFGAGINLNTGYLSTLKNSALGVFTSSWCLDYYIKQSVPTTGGVAHGPVLFVNNNVSNQEFTTRFEIDHLNVTNIFQNSQGPSYSGSIATTNYISTNYYHYAIQYLNGRIYIFKDGVLNENISFNITGTTWKDLAIIGNLSRGTPSSSYATIDRYRLRTGQYFDVAGFDVRSIYPGIKIS